MKSYKSKSEKQLKEFLQFKDNPETVIRLSLVPQGDLKAIQKDPLNICKVEISGVTYLFGAIREGFYDEMVRVFDWHSKEKTII